MQKNPGESGQNAPIPKMNCSDIISKNLLSANNAPPVYSNSKQNPLLSSNAKISKGAENMAGRGIDYFKECMFGDNSNKGTAVIHNTGSNYQKQNTMPTTTGNYSGIGNLSAMSGSNVGGGMGASVNINTGGINSSIGVFQEKLSKLDRDNKTTTTDKPDVTNKERILMLSEQISNCSNKGGNSVKNYNDSQSTIEQRLNRLKNLSNMVGPVPNGPVLNSDSNGILINLQNLNQNTNYSVHSTASKYFFIV